MTAILKLAFASLLAGALAAVAPTQEKPPAEKPARKKTPALERVLAASDADREKAMVGYLEAEMDTGAVYAGQFAGLAEAKDACLQLLQAMAVEAPAAAKRADDLRLTAIRALRDLVADEDPDELKAGVRKTLGQLIADEFEADSVKEAAIYALAQLGERGRVDQAIAAAKKGTEHKDPRMQAGAWYQLSDIHYNLREYAAAAEAYQKVLALHEAGQIQLGKLGLNLPTVYYNAACSATLAGQVEEAFALLEKALQERQKGGAGLERVLLETDMDIDALRADPRFGPLVEKYLSAPKKDDQGEAAPREKDKQDGGK